MLYTGGATFCYFLIVQYMRGLPYEIIEAARIDGAGPFRIFWTIVLPLIRPILTTVIVFQTMGTWNDFMTPSVYISSTNKQTIVLQVFNAISTFTTNWPLFMTVTTIALIRCSCSSSSASVGSWPAWSPVRSRADRSSCLREFDKEQRYAL